MCLCDKCRFYNKCYPRELDSYMVDLQKCEMELDGYPCYEELTINEMFAEKED